MLKYSYDWQKYGIEREESLTFLCWRHILEVFSELSGAYMRGQLRLSFEETAQEGSPTKLLGHKTSSQ